MKIDTLGPAPTIQLDHPDILLTESQAEALQFDSERIVSAGAGSGKTQTLSLRYTCLLLHQAWQGVQNSTQPSIEDVVVLTFTDKAAKEMLARCYTQLRKAGEAVEHAMEDIGAKWGEKKSQQYVANIRRFLDRFEQARISTFHSFCNRLLREEGLLHGIHHNTQLLEDYEIARWQKRAVRETYSAWRTQVEPDVFNSIAQCFRGRADLEKCVAGLLSERTKFIDATTPWGVRGALIKALLAEAPMTTTEVRQWIETEATSVLEQVAAQLQPAEPPFYKQTLLPLLEKVHHPPTDPLALNHLFREILSPFTKTDRTQDFGRQAIIGRSDLWVARSSRALYTANKAALKALRQSCDHWPGLLQKAEAQPTPSDTYGDDVMAGVGQLFFLARAHLEQQHRAAHVIDHDGLQIQALRLLRQHADLRKKLQDRHRYVMVDEFQDTDAVQWEILELIGRPEGRQEDRLFAVGDLKQAIYRFRGGDVSVFNDVRKDIGVETTFAHNFRSRKAIVDFTNDFFHSVMGTAGAGRNPWEAHYEPVQAGREENTTSHLRLLPIEHSNAKDTAYEEGRAIAGVCKELLDPSGPYAHERYADTVAHPEEPIAILIRQRTHLGQYQKALRDAGVPYRVVKGVGFWSRPCVIDLITTLHAAITNDPISLIGFLRSPLACASDTDIHRFFHRDPPLGLAPQHFISTPSAPDWPPVLTQAHALLRNAAARAKQTNLRTVAERVLTEGGAFHAWQLEGRPDEDRANIQKLLERISQLEHQGWSAARILEFFIEQIEHKPKENEADGLRGDTRVVVQTIHSAKGLEFPVVFLPSLGAKRTQNDSVHIGKDAQGWSFAIKTPDPSAPVATKVDTVRTTQFRERRTAEERAEDLRLLYVAVTRAAEHLFFVGDPKKAPKNSWMSHLLPFLDGPEGQTGHIALHEAELPEFTAAPTLSPQRSLTPFRPIKVEDIHPISPSSLKSFQDCPLCWKRRRTVGTPRIRISQEDHNLKAGAARGKLLHELLERQCFDTTVATETWKAEAQALHLPETVASAQLRRLVADLEGMANDKALQAILDGETYFEAAYDIRWNAIRMQGRIDLLWRDPEEGDWVLIDFKSEHINEQDVTQHLDQLTAYAWAASRLLGIPVHRTEIYSTRSAKRLPLPTLQASDFSAFELRLGRVEQYAKMTYDEAIAQYATDPKSVPCEHCLSGDTRPPLTRINP